MSEQQPVIGIAGFGMEGRAVYEYFKGEAELHVFDERPIPSVSPDVIMHKGLEIPESIEILYKSPGIPTSKVRLASRNTRISTFMNLVLEKVGKRTIGVTGTKGKSTVTALIYHVLKSRGEDVVLFGNIGLADAKTLKTDVPGRTYVIELSSYQCEHLTHSPHIAVLTNFFPEHLTHHGSLERYREAKLNIARFQTSSDAFINGSDLEVSFEGHVARSRAAQYGHIETKLLGEHNQQNAAVALSALASFGVPKTVARPFLATFEPLPYRLERVGTFEGTTFYDDSLATVPEATLASIHALPRVDTIILGGEDRGISFEAFARALSDTHIQTFIIFPETGEKMVTHVNPESVVRVSSMDEAVREAFTRTPKDGVVLLSNASPSFNLFKDYKDKSAKYRDAIKRASMTP